MRMMLFLMLSVIAMLADIGRVQLVVGDVTIERSGKSIKVAQDTLIEVEDIIKTGKNAFTKIIFEDETNVIIGRNSIFIIQEYSSDEDQKAGFKILKGVLETTTGKIGKIAPEKFNVNTKTSKIGVRGTTFQVETDGVSDTIACTDGSIGVTELSTGATVIVQEGQVTEVTAGSAPSEPRAIETGDLTDIESGSADAEDVNDQQSETDVSNNVDSGVVDTQTDSGTTTTSTTPSNSVSSNSAPSGLTQINTSVSEDATISGSVSASDADGDSLTYSLTSSAPTGLTFNSDGTYSFNADSYDSLGSGSSQTVTFTYNASDGSASITQTGAIVINGINDAPTIASTPTVKVTNSIAGATIPNATNTLVISVMDLLGAVTDSDSGDTLELTAAPVIESGFDADDTVACTGFTSTDTCTLVLSDDVGNAGVTLTYSVTDSTDTVSSVVTNVDIGVLDKTDYSSSSLGGIVYNFPGDGTATVDSHTNAVEVGSLSDSPYSWGYWANVASSPTAADIASVWVSGPRTKDSYVNTLINNTTQNYVYEASSSSTTNPVFGVFLNTAIIDSSTNALLRLEIDWGAGASTILEPGDGNLGTGSYFRFTEPGGGWGAQTHHINFLSSAVVNANGVYIPTASTSVQGDTMAGYSSGRLSGLFYGQSAGYLGGTFNFIYSSGTVRGGFLAEQTSP